MSSAPQPDQPKLSTQARQRLAAAGGLFVLICIGAWFYVDSQDSPRGQAKQPVSALRQRYPDLLPRRLPDSMAVWRRSTEAAESSYGPPRPPRMVRPDLSADARRQKIRAMLQKQNLDLQSINPAVPGFSTPNFSPSYPLRPEEVQVKLGATVLELVASRDEGDVWFYGVLKNTGEGPIDHPRIDVTMWNEGRTEKVGSAYGFTDRFVLGPNEVTPFRVLAKAAPRFANATATVEVRRPFTDRRLGKLQLVQHTLTQQSPLILIKGTVKNIDDKPQHFVKVIALARDTKGRPIGYASAYVTTKRLAPGASASFSSYFLLDRKPVHIDFDLEGSPAD
ncbi:MAG: FxLYD domain-containing protein [Polyangia bacterium]